MIVQILKARQKTWYQDKRFEYFDVIDTGHKTLYYLSPKQLKKMKKAKHLQIAIHREDCECGGETEEDLSRYNIDNILKAIPD